MEKYNYLSEMRENIFDYLNDNHILLSDYGSHEEMYESLYDQMWDDDSITGNILGYASTEKCEEYLLHNLDLLFLALDDFGQTYRELEHIEREHLPIFLDATIRCYLLSDALEQVILQLENSGKKYRKEIEE